MDSKSHEPHASPFGWCFKTSALEYLMFHVYGLTYTVSGRTTCLISDLVGVLGTEELPLHQK